MSKSSFMEKLTFYLSFYFNHNDSESILNDYEEWFENEASHGKSEEEICLALEPPQKIAKKMFSESGSNTIKTLVLLQNTFVQTSLLLLAHIVISLLLLKYCNKHAADYFYSALCINFIYFVIGLFIVKSKQTTRLNDPVDKSYKNKLFMSILDLAVLIMFAAPIFLNRSSYIYIGVLYNVVINIFALILFAVNLYLNTKILQDKQTNFFRMIHISGMITLLLFFSNHTHLINGSTGYISGSIAIYAEIIILQVIFYLIGNNFGISV